ncbi:MAG: RNase adapter RapZ [Desulfobacterales bacterium]|nr:RNase adapter RapZ [Desulfobacterales bacterium]
MKKPKIIIVTGLSGSGKSTALAALEDAGFYCVDNMPVLLLPDFLELPNVCEPGVVGFAFGMDLREKSFLGSYQTIFEDVRVRGFELEIIFLEADEKILLRRYSQTRRHHPVARGEGILDGIRAEQRLMAVLRKSAEYVLNTSQLNVHELKAAIKNIAKKLIKLTPMRIQVLSFGFKHGIPGDADLVIDVRFLVNPYFVPELKDLDGETEAVKRFVLKNDDARLFLSKYFDLVDYLIPLYEKEGKAYLTIAIGCTGGRHRSVAIARRLYEHVQTAGREVAITHRDIDQQ